MNNLNRIQLGLKKWRRRLLIGVFALYFTGVPFAILCYKLILHLLKNLFFPLHSNWGRKILILIHT
jgi:hypothetical protein